MALFVDWMVFRDVAALLQLLETAEYFDPAAYNVVFDGELDKMLARIPNNEAKQQAAEMRGFDWGGYVERSLRRAGYKDDDIQEHFQQIVVKLLVSPGKLFANWQGNFPFLRRLRRSVWNAIRNIAEKSRNRRKWTTSADPSLLAAMYAGRESNSDLIDEFRQLVLQRLGKLALAILDTRLSGEDTKDLVRNGTASAFYVKRAVQSIKQLARQFATQSGDQVFLYKLSKAMEQESETVAKRQQALAARRAGG